MHVLWKHTFVLGYKTTTHKNQAGVCNRVAARGLHGMCLKVSGTTLNTFLTLGIMIRVENLDQKMYCSDIQQPSDIGLSPLP